MENIYRNLNLHSTECFIAFMLLEEAMTWNNVFKLCISESSFHSITNRQQASTE